MLVRIDKIFSVKTLTRKPRILKADFFWALIRSGYLPEELPPVITTKYFSDHCKANHPYWLANYKKIIKLSTIYDIFSVPRATTGRRLLALVNPIAQLGLSLIISENRASIKKVMSRSSISLYENIEHINEGKAFKGLNFENWHKYQDAISSEYPFAVKADISRFFYTIYTHSIPWAVFGKNFAKKNYKQSNFKAHWSNELDIAIQSCQSRETFGIPVGPDTSRIVSEILMSGIEQENDFLKGLKLSKAVRLIDDIYIGENSYNDALNTLDEVKNALLRFNLQVNEDKTLVTETKMVFDEYWKRDFNEHLLPRSKKISDKNKVKLIVDAALHHCKIEKSELPAIWACRRLISISESINDKISLVDAFFRLGRDFPSTSKHVAEFLINNKINLSESKTIERISTLVKSAIAFNYSKKNDLEFSWMLLIAGIYSIKLNQTDFGKIDYVPGSIAFAIIGLLRQHSILDFPLSVWDWRPRFKDGGIYGKDWLPMYESVLRRWTTDKKIIALVKSCPYFSVLLVDKVSFLDDSIFKVSKIDFKRRKFVVSETKSKVAPIWLKGVDFWRNLSNYQL
jgi:hypothetical protein